MLLGTLVIATLASASAANVLPAKEPQHVCAGESTVPALTADVVVPIVLPIPGLSVIALGNITVSTLTNGTFILKKLLTFPGLNTGIDYSISSTLGLKQPDTAIYTTDPLDPEVEIQIQEEDIDVRINGVDGSTAVDIFF